MVFSKWKGALAVFVTAAGLAWAQSSSPNVASAQKIVVLHENGKSVRCQVVQSWRLPNGSQAQQLRAVDSGELITILDDDTPVSAAAKTQGQPKRIFHWGLKSRTPPPGTPIPPALMVDSGVIIKKEFDRPKNVIPAKSGPVAVNTPAKSGPVAVNTPAKSGPVAVNTPAKSGPVAVHTTVVGPSVTTVSAKGPIITTGATTRPIVANGPCDDCKPAGETACKGPIIISEKILGTTTIHGPTIVQGNCESVIVCGKTSTPPTKEWSVPSSPAKKPLTLPVIEPLSITTPPSSAQPTRAEAMPPSTAQPARTETTYEPVKIDAKKMFGKVPERNPMPLVSSAVEKRTETVTLLATPEKVVPTQNQQKSTEVVITEQPSSGWPLGAQSVLAAKSGLHGPVTYVPVPLVAVPRPWHPPVPPDPKTPEAPQLNAYVNAFTPPPNSRPKNQSMTPANPQMAYNPMMMPYANPMQMQQMMAQGYNPYQMQQAMYGHPMMRQAVSPASYQGPLPPANPFAPQMPAVQPGAYYFPQMPAMQPGAYTVPQMPAGVQPVGYFVPQTLPTAITQAPAVQSGQIEQVLNVLRDSPYPAERERAAQVLAGFDYKLNGQVIPGLIYSATQDPAPTVRAGCVANLARLGASTPQMRTAIEILRTDSDPRVREQAEQAVLRMTTPMKTN